MYILKFFRIYCVHFVIHIATDMYLFTVVLYHVYNVYVAWTDIAGMFRRLIFIYICILYSVFLFISFCAVDRTNNPLSKKKKQPRVPLGIGIHSTRVTAKNNGYSDSRACSEL